MGDLINFVGFLLLGEWVYASAVALVDEAAASLMGPSLQPWLVSWMAAWPRSLIIRREGRIEADNHGALRLEVGGHGVVDGSMGGRGNRQKSRRLRRHWQWTTLTLSWHRARRQLLKKPMPKPNSQV
jgi:hypothetical protein